MYLEIRINCDLGNYLDEYIGCNIQRGLGDIYNENDRTTAGYVVNPTAIALDFLQWPLADDNDGIIDELKELSGLISCTIIMINSNRESTKPSSILNDLQSIWQNDLPITSCENGRNQENQITTFRYADDEVNENCSLWTEQSAGNVINNRRFVQSVGTFTIVKNITTALIWSRTDTGGVQGSIEKLKVDDDYIQELFNNCFKIPCIEPNGSLASYKVLIENYGLSMEYPLQFNIPSISSISNKT